MYVVDVATFVLAAAIFLRLRLPERDRGASDESFDRGTYVADLREGGRVLTGSVLGQVLVAALLANALAGLRSAVLPAFADGLGGAAVYGLLLAALSAGAVVGAVAASPLETVPFGRVTRVGFLASGLCIAGGVLAESTASTAALFFLGTVPVGAYNVLVQAAVQTGVPDGLLGRVTAALGSATAVVGPLGTLLGGVLGDLVGSRAVLLASAGGYVLAAVHWALVPALRRFPPVRSLEPGRFAPG
jgi:MFS family permease